MSEQKEKRKTFTTDQVICPEGIWIPEAMLLFHEKNHGDVSNIKKIGDVAREFLSFLLTKPKLEVFKIDSNDGFKDAVEKDYLRSKSAQTDILQGYISHNYYKNEDDGYYIFVNKIQFENYLEGKPLIDTEESELKQTEYISQSYIPPYMNFMLQAVKALDLKPDSRTNKDTIIKWLNQNWSPDLEGKSDRLIETMATLIRRPEDKKGGNTSWK